MRKDAEDIYRSSNRNDLADKEMAERIILEEFVPKKLTEEETKTAVETAISETCVSLPKEKGKLIGFLRSKYGEQLDMRIAMKFIG